MGNEARTIQNHRHSGPRPPGSGTTLPQRYTLRTCAPTIDLSLLTENRPYFDWKNVAESLFAWTLQQNSDFQVVEEDNHFYCRSRAAPEPLIWAFLDRGHTAAELRSELEDVWPRISPGGVLAGHDYRQPSWPEVAPVVDEWAEGMGLNVHFVPPYSFWVQKPAEHGVAPFKVWNQEVLISTTEDHAFNPSICPHPENPAVRLFAFRSVRGMWDHGRVWIGVVDSTDLQFVHPPRQLSLEAEDINCEDPRIFTLGPKVYLSYTATDWRTGVTISEQRLVQIKETSRNHWEPAADPVRFPSPFRRPQEKNWAYLDTGNKGITALYSTSPEWIVYRLSMRSPKLLRTRATAPGVFWPFGEIRGGTPFSKAPNGHWWTFFHSSCDHDPSVFPEPASYYNGLFPEDLCGQLRPPRASLAGIPVHGRYFAGLLEADAATLQPLRISREPLLYHHSLGPSRVGYQVVWPAGAFREGDEVILAYGVNDDSCRCCRFSATLLDALLDPIAPST